MSIHDHDQSTRRDDDRARRAAKRIGYIARKSRWRKESIDNHGGFMIVDPETNGAVAGFQFDLDADDVLAWCKN